MSDGPDSSTDRFRTVVYGFAGTAGFAFAAWLGASVNAMAERLTTVEVTINENKAEREAQIADLRSRVNRLEDKYAYTRDGRGAE